MFMVVKNSIKDLIDKFESRKAFADEVGVNVEVVHKWAATGRIPAPLQASVVRAAQARGIFHVTAEWMIQAHDAKGVNA